MENGLCDGCSMPLDDEGVCKYCDLGVDMPVDVDAILDSLGPEFDEIEDSPYGSAYTPEQWPAVLDEVRKQSRFRG